MKKLFTLLAIISCHFLFAQKVVKVDEGDVNGVNFFMAVSGEPIVMAKFTKVVEGSPFYDTEWHNATVTLKSKQVFHKIRLRIELISDEVHFRDDKGREMIAYSNIARISLRKPAGDTVHFVHSTELGTPMGLKKGWYGELVNDSIDLLTYFFKEIRDEKPYGSATWEQRIRTTQKYYLNHNNVLWEIKKLKDAIQLFPDHKKELEEWVKENDMGSLEFRLVNFTKHINQLLKKTETKP